jgi:hypothetical protein
MWIEYRESYSVPDRTEKRGERSEFSTDILSLTGQRKDGRKPFGKDGKEG